MARDWSPIRAISPIRSINMDKVSETVANWWDVTNPYERVGDDADDDGTVASESDERPLKPAAAFSWADYLVFALLGMAMLWSWNMFLAASQYFKSRLAGSAWLQAHFLAGITTVSTVTNMAGIFVLTKLQRAASYPRRIAASLGLSTLVFLGLALSTVTCLDAPPASYYGFLLAAVFLASAACALIQNGLFAYVTGFGAGENQQAIMVGQGVAGVLPCIVQLVAVLAVPDRQDAAAGPDAAASTRPAFLYFLTAAAVASLSLLAFAAMLYRHRRHARTHAPRLLHGPETTAGGPTHSVGMATLARKLRWFALAEFLTFGVTMLFPVFTQKVVSVRSEDSSGALFRPAAFVPLGFLVWNVGDLLGRVLPLVRALRADRAPRWVCAAAVARLVFVPLYLSCNLDGRGAWIQSDAFYLGVVQLLFGATNGYLSTVAMMAAPAWVAPHEREAAGSFIGLCMVSGLTAGSLVSFTVT